MTFEEHLKTYLDDIEINNLIASFSEKEHKGLLLNTNKINDEEFLLLFPNVIKHPVVPHCFLFNKDEYEFGKMPYHDLGLYYIQDPSASLVSYILDPKPGMNILDLCAAPGGKTIEASLLGKGKNVIYANDLSSSRANILLSNIERLGLGNVVVLNLDFSKEKHLKNTFDAIILDAPCSGSGMFRRSEEMKKDWSYDKVLRCQVIQKELIILAYSMLKPGGKLVYSTCSYSKEEDEDIVNYLLDNTDAKLLNIENHEGYYRSNILKETVHLFPHRFVGEGHFIALIQKPGEIFYKQNNEEETITRNALSKSGNKIQYEFSLPQAPIQILTNKAIRPGLLKYEISKDKKQISHHYSHNLSSINSYELNDDEYKKYIHGETINIKEDKKYDIVSYKKHNIGVVSSVNRVLKNYYPKGLRR